MHTGHGKDLGEPDLPLSIRFAIIPALDNLSVLLSRKQQQARLFQQIT
jgi:hypothetical protein